MTEIEKLTQERDYFKASYERTLNEHAETLRDYQHERDELRAKLAQTTAQNARYRAALEPFAEAAKYYEDPPGTITHDEVKLWQRGRRIDYLTCGDLRKAAAALAQSPAASLEALRAEAGRERAVRELDALEHSTISFSVEATGQFIPLWLITQRKAEIEAEGRV